MILFAICLTAAALGFLMRWVWRRDAKRLLEEFEVRFGPDVCPICSCGRAAAREGCELSPLSHRCPERRPMNEAAPAVRESHEAASADTI